MIETYRMLAREHQADLEREARRRRLAARARRATTARRPGLVSRFAAALRGRRPTMTGGLVRPEYRR
jgi:hypothetical protein